MEFDRRQIFGAATSLTVAGLAGPAFAEAPADPLGIPLHLIHPDLRVMAANIAKFTAGQKQLTRESLLASRKGMSKNPFMRKPLETVPFEKRMIPVGKGHPDVAIYLVNAKAGTSRPAILHTHGGGYIMGNAESSVRQLQDICAELDCVAVSVDYRLAPETTYAGSIEDNYAGLKWLAAHAAEIGADPKRIAVMGESAGGGHAALLAITARDRGEVPLAFQCLIYPMLDDRTGTSRPQPPHVGTLIWTPVSNRLGWECFLGQAAGGRTAPKGSVPARVADLKGLPPAFIGVGSLDLFCNEDVDYAQRLNDAGVPAELLLVPGAFHGFDGIPGDYAVSKWFNAAKLTALKRGLGIVAG